MTLSHRLRDFGTLALLDAGACLFMGLGLLLAAGPLAAATALPEALLFYAGLLLLPVAGLMLLAAYRPSRLLTALVVTGNAAWALASIALLLSGWVAPNPLGVALIAGQAAAVAGLTLLEASAALRHATAAA